MDPIAKVRRDGGPVLDQETGKVVARGGRLTITAVPAWVLADEVEGHRPLENVLAGLGLPVPETELEFEPKTEAPTEPERPTAPPRPRGRRQPVTGRPSPFGGEANNDIADRFFAGNFRKGNAWLGAEQECLSRFEGRIRWSSGGSEGRMSGARS